MKNMSLEDDLDEVTRAISVAHLGRVEPAQVVVLNGAQEIDATTITCVDPDGNQTKVRIALDKEIRRYKYGVSIQRRIIVISDPVSGQPRKKDVEINLQLIVPSLVSTQELGLYYGGSLGDFVQEYLARRGPYQLVDIARSIHLTKAEWND